MSLLDDFSEFLNSRLDEYLKSNPELELQILLLELDQQEQNTLQMITELQRLQQRSETELVQLAEEIKIWHERINLAMCANRPDLATAAGEREAILLAKGNQVWQQMSESKNRQAQAKQLLNEIQQKRQELNARIPQVRSNYTYNSQNSYDPLEAEFAGLDIDDELDNLKRNTKPPRG